MKLLLCINSLSEFPEVHRQIQMDNGAGETPPFLSTGVYANHEITICETGYGIFQSTYKITKALCRERFHLALKFGRCKSYHPEIEVGTVVNVIKDKPGDLGYYQDGSFIDYYESRLLDASAFPHFRNSFLNMNNSYMNVFLPIRKVVAVTMNSSDKHKVPALRERYKADIETDDGLGFVYACMSERQPFYQLQVVQQNLVTEESDEIKAKLMADQHLLSILQKL
ncbi:MAG: hypothetical protein U0T73_04025 [Chitinophagales bacterium]